MMKIIFCLMLVATFINEVSTQYFKGNKVRYQYFDYRKLVTEHLDIIYFPVEKSARMLNSPQLEGRNPNETNKPLLSEKEVINLSHVFSPDRNYKSLKGFYVL